MWAMTKAEVTLWNQVVRLHYRELAGKNSCF